MLNCETNKACNKHTSCYKKKENPLATLFRSLFASLLLTDALLPKLASSDRQRGNEKAKEMCDKGPREVGFTFLPPSSTRAKKAFSRSIPRDSSPGSRTSLDPFAMQRQGKQGKLPHDFERQERKLCRQPNPRSAWLN